jgi:hypothetical protein
MDPDFRSVDGTERVVTYGQRLWFDLGYDTGERKLAVFDGRELRIERRRLRPEPIDDSRCHRAHEAISVCIAHRNDRNLGDYAFEQFLGLVDTATRNALRGLRHDPGFSAGAFMQSCMLSTDTGLMPDYDAFAAQVCTP